MSSKRTTLAVLVALSAAGLFFVLREDSAPAAGGPAVPRAQFEETLVEEPPPVVEPTPDSAARRAYWLSMLSTGSEDDVAWARRQIAHAGPQARDEVLRAAERTLVSNTAFLQQALDILLESPGDDCATLAVEALASRDPHVVTRALLLLGQVRAPDGALARIGELAAERPYPVPQHAMSALARAGTAEAARVAVDAVGRMQPAQRAYGYIALAALGGDEVREFLRGAFEEETDPSVKLGAAEALVALEDATPIAWLHAELDRLDAAVWQREAALRVLAKARDERARAELLARVDDVAANSPERAAAIETLAPYPLDGLRETLLRAAEGHGAGDIDARVAAVDRLVREQAPGAWQELVRHLTSPVASDRRVSALVLGRHRTPEGARALVAALPQLAPDDIEHRRLYLRALCLASLPETAETLVRAFVDDHETIGVGGTAFEVLRVLGETTPEFRAAFGAHVVRALDGAYGAPSDSGLWCLLHAVPTCCDASAAAPVERQVAHADRDIREAAVTALAFVGRAESLVVLRRAWRAPQDQLLRSSLRDTIAKLQFRAE